MLALLKSLAEALRLYLLVQAQRGKWDLQNDITERLHDDFAEIRRLRSSGSMLDRELADRLLREVEARNRLANDIRSVLAGVPVWEASCVDGGNVRTGDGRDMVQPKDPRGTSGPADGRP